MLAKQADALDRIRSDEVVAFPISAPISVDTNQTVQICGKILPCNSYPDGVVREALNLAVKIDAPIPQLSLACRLSCRA
jgi:hypothetical protein